MDGASSQPCAGLPGYRQCCGACPRVFRPVQECGRQQSAERTVGVSRHRLLRLLPGGRVLLRSVSLTTLHCDLPANSPQASLKSQTQTSPPNPKRPSPPPATSTSPSATSTPSSGASRPNSATSAPRSPSPASSSTTSQRSSPASAPRRAPTSSPWPKLYSQSAASSPV
jgi:hypothetical protein